MINKNLIMTIVFGVLLGACSKLEGTLKVNRTFDVHQGSGSRAKQITFIPGDYQATVRAGSKSTKMKISGGPQRSKATVTLPKLDGFKNLWRNNEIYLKGEQIQQDFDLKIVLTNEVSNGGERRGSESCVYDTREERDYVCRTERVPTGSREVCKEKDGRQVCRTVYDYRDERVCGWETRTVTIYGEREYAGYTSYEKRGGTVTLIENGAVVARMFDKGASRSDFHRTYTGYCRL